ncbi:MAG: hypothetical protein UW03_C0006G0080 [Candidatus Peregrinibacteria bacterium GW2011_GWA2_43_8]|nr:MAG: hypothetical protein UW03_C0006G0080 [Candidatus Peregrinibacteria bacterium GW2011_GWA2_43_8]
MATPAEKTRLLGKSNSSSQFKTLLKAQRNEVTEHMTYASLAAKAGGKNKKILEHVARDELRHYRAIRELTGQDIGPNMLKVKFYIFLCSIFGVAFSLKLMEKGEALAQEVYSASDSPVLRGFLKDEQKHEKELLGMLSDSKVDYAGSIVLGLNDALVELTGALAGLTFALGSAQLIAMIGFITGIAASLSMAASEYLSATEEADIHKGHQKPGRGAAYTGIAYIITVLILITPFLLLPNAFIALAITLVLTVSVIAFYTFYISVAKGHSFWGRFGRMAAISLGVAGISFVIGLLVKIYFGVEA